LYDVQYLDVIDCSRFPTIVLIDESLQTHFLQLKENNHSLFSSTSDKRWPNIWSYRLNRIIDKQKNQRRRRKDYLYQQDVLTIPPEDWMREYECLCLKASGNSILMLLQTKGRNSDNQQTLVSYDITKSTFEVLMLDSIVSLCLCDNPVYPTLMLSRTSINIPTYGTSQEQLIDTVCIVLLSMLLK